MSKIIRRNALAALAVIATVVPFSLRATSVRSSALQVAVPLTDDKGKPSNDISGISCLEPQGGKRTCVVIDDQGRLAQVATVEASTLTGQAKIRLIGKAHAPVDIAGTEPGIDPKVVKCSAGKDDFKDLDGEAVALDDKFFYVVGSHGCSRNSNKFRTSSFILARVPIDVVRTASGAPNNVDTIGPKSTSYRLSEALLASPTLKDHYALDLMTKNGLNIEGLAVAGGKLYVGLRAPVIGKKAYLVAVDRDWLFDASRPVAQADIREIDLDLGGPRDPRSRRHGGRPASRPRWSSAIGRLFLRLVRRGASEQDGDADRRTRRCTRRRKGGSVANLGASSDHARSSGSLRQREGWGTPKVPDRLEMMIGGEQPFIPEEGGSNADGFEYHSRVGLDDGFAENTGYAAVDVMHDKSRRSDVAGDLFEKTFDRDRVRGVATIPAHTVLLLESLKSGFIGIAGCDGDAHAAV
ncbi:hypothetical protein ACVL91_007275 [Bradyrhizobium elkanii]|uniref:DUF3616 domain-containing protein n=2 Tax=Bradyrhizobium TaxID=374 RepID=A0A8I2BWY2_BRAEL|nr:DUF3616 domain-containing protein [Bradyrhizobium elkanii]MBP1290405.1 hypothetical protein [Bradyrhizobium elkanii]